MDCSPDHAQKFGNTLVQVQMQVHGIAASGFFQNGFRMLIPDGGVYSNTAH
jgi:hypothetical protein